MWKSFFATDYRKRFLLKLAVFCNAVFLTAQRVCIGRGLCCGKMSVRPSVCRLSVTRRYAVETVIDILKFFHHRV